MNKQPGINRMVARHFWDISWQFKPEILLVWFIAVQAFCVGTLIPFWIGKILASLGHAGEDPLRYLPALLITIVVGVVTNFIGFRALFVLQPKGMKALETESYDALLKRSVGFHNNNIAGKLVSDATQYPTSFAQFTNAFFVNVLQFGVAMITGVILISAHSWKLGLLVFVMTVSVIALAIYQTVAKNDDRLARHRARQKMVAHMADTVTNAVTVKTFAQEAREMQDHVVLMDKIAWHRTRDWTRLAGEGSRRIGVLLGFEVAFIVLVVHLVKQDPTLLSIGIFTFSYAISLTSKLFEIGSLFRTFEDSLTDASDMMRIVAGDAEVVDAPGARDLEVTKGAITFDQVGFRYDDAAHDDTVFQALDVAIKPGEKVGLVGPSGGGKSTLTRLLLRFEDIQHGTISIDGQSIKDVTQTSLRRQISYVPQEPLLFHRSIAQNIGFGVPGATPASIRQAAEQAYALGFIDALPNGFDTIVGERGVKLSGGQRQRIAIARAILKDAPILVLDEATSALDSESEVAVQAALKSLIENRTTLVIAHRLSTIQKMDRILVLKDGVIVEQGSHSSLVKKKAGLYATLWKHQSGGFIED